MDDKRLKKEKTRAILHWISGITALISFAVTLLLSPLGDFLRTPENPAETNVVSTTGSAENPASPQSAEDTTLKVESTKNYSLLIYKKEFISAEDGDKTMIYAKASKDANMTITPIKGTSYSALCDKTDDEHKKISDYQEINSSNAYSVYETKSEGIIKRVYCIDDGEGSSIEIKYQYPEGNKDIKEDFDILLSMFKTK